MKNWILRWVASILALLVIVWVYSVYGGSHGHPGIWVESPTAPAIRSCSSNASRVTTVVLLIPGR